MFAHILKFVGILAVLYILSMIPFGIYLNAGIVMYSFWKLTD